MWNSGPQSHCQCHRFERVSFPLCFRPPDFPRSGWSSSSPLSGTLFFEFIEGCYYTFNSRTGKSLTKLASAPDPLDVFFMAGLGLLIGSIFPGDVIVPCRTLMEKRQ